MFGDEVWKNTIIGVTHWPFDKQSTIIRKSEEKSEEKLLADINQQLRKTYNLTFDLPGVFIHAYSQLEYSKDDDVQQEAFYRETQKLWNFATTRKAFSFRTIEDIQHSIDKLKEELSKRRDVRRKVRKSRSFVLYLIGVM